MKIVRILTTLIGASIVFGLTLVMVLPAQEPTPESAETAVTSNTAEAEIETSRDDDMRELGADDEAPVPPMADDAPDAPSVEVPDTVGAILEQVTEEIETAIHEGMVEAMDNSDEKGRSNRGNSHSREIINFGSDVHLAEGKTSREIVSILGGALVEGDAQREVVAILGDVTVQGSVGGDVVAVLGDVTINGRVDGQVVSVLGRVQLGPEAVVDGEIVSVGGTIDQAPGSVVRGSTNQIAFMGEKDVDLDWLKAWIKNCLLFGRPLAVADNLGWAWMIAACFLGFYCLIALLMPSLVTQCAKTMEKKPGMSVLSAVLTLLITPIAMIVLSVTVVGPPILGLLIFFVAIFGKVVFFGWLGRRITEPAGWNFPALAVLLGGLISTAIYLVPFVGFAFQKLGGLIGTGIVVYTIILAMQANQIKPPAPAVVGGAPSTPPSTPPSSPESVTAAAASESYPRQSANFGAAIPPVLDASVEPTNENPATAEVPSDVPPPLRPPPAPAAAEIPVQLSTLPRVGFWERLAATFLDVIVVGIVVGLLGLGDYFAVWATAYFITFWVLRGTTLGGVVMGIKVVRMDDRPVDWSVALVRGLGSFLSLFVMGLGFLWVAWDPQRQSWHDKIAGTIVVKMPNGVSLI